MELELYFMIGLGKWESAIARSSRPKARGKKPSQGKSLLSKKEQSSRSGESAAVHLAQSSLADFGDKIGMSDHDPAVGRTVERLAVAGSDASAQGQEKEVRSVGGIPSR